MQFERERNHELELAEGYVQQTGEHVFLTGKAGTGKTTFLKKLQTSSSKRMVTTAPTGVAALNAGGVTLHSFFQLPFGPFVPGSEAFERDRQRQYRFSKEKKKIVQSLDLLVIDEISMVRADLLDAVDAALRRHRRSSQPFGGVQLLMIGDLHQLSPVAKADEWELLQEYYESIYFFSSRALAETRFVTLELERVYRQSDDSFIQILNKIRDDNLDSGAVQKLNTRCFPDFAPTTEQGYITLTSHNKKAQNINQRRLQELSGQEYRFPAKVSGEFPDNIHPVPSELLLKPGAQVMFVRNDPGPDKLYYNGKIGRITAISQEEIQVLCAEDRESIKVEPLTWENIKYVLNPESKAIEEKVIGSFVQYPLKLAWAITIHKSQGLTFDRAVIDVQNAFAHGQVYVALSRCRHMQGMVLSSPFTSRGLGTDEAVVDFGRQVRQNQPTTQHLQQAKVAFQQQLLLECFDLSSLRGRLKHILRLLRENSRIVQVTGVQNVHDLEPDTEEVFKVSRVFLRELGHIFAPDRVPEEDAYLLERINKGSKWFQDQLEGGLGQALSALDVETDNAELKKRLTTTLDNLKKDLAVKLAGIRSCEQGFSPPAYLQAVAKAEVGDASKRRTKQEAGGYTEADIAHPDLFQTLKQWRTAKAKELGLPAYQVLHQRVIVQIAVTLPQTLAELEKIRGVGPKTRGQYGQELIDMVAAYRSQHGIEQVILPEKPKSGQQSESREPKKDTKQVSLDLFKQGHNPAQIAEARGLAQSTIEGHLSSLVEHKELHIDELLSRDRQEAIARAIAQSKGNSLKEIKDMLDEDISYGQIKMVLAHQRCS